MRHTLITILLLIAFVCGRAQTKISLKICVLGADWKDSICSALLVDSIRIGPKVFQKGEFTADSSSVTLVVGEKGLIFATVYAGDFIGNTEHDLIICRCCSNAVEVKLLNKKLYEETYYSTCEELVDLETLKRYNPSFKNARFYARLLKSGIALKAIHGLSKKICDVVITGGKPLKKRDRKRLMQLLENVYSDMKRRDCRLRFHV